MARPGGRIYARDDSAAHGDRKCGKTGDGIPLSRSFTAPRSVGRVGRRNSWTGRSVSASRRAPDAFFLPREHRSVMRRDRRSPRREPSADSPA